MCPALTVHCPSSFVQVRFQYSSETVIGFIIPYAIIMTSYIKIVRRLKQTRFRRTVRSEKLILGIVVTFGLLWLPYHVINMVQVRRFPMANLACDLCCYLLYPVLNGYTRYALAVTFQSMCFKQNCLFLCRNMYKQSQSITINSTKKVLLKRH